MDRPDRRKGGFFDELKRRNVLRMAVLYVVTAWLIVQVAEAVVGLAGLPEWVGQALLGILAIGFPIALIFAWVYELTPEGLKLEKKIDRADSITHVTGRRMDFVVIAMLSAALVVFAYDKWWRMPGPPTDEPPPNSIAVLAFENMSPDPDQEYISDGVSEEILNVLSRVPDLQVTARSSAFTFKDKDVDVPTMAEQLGVAHVLEGSVRVSENRIRITAQLINADDGFHLWSSSYDRELGDIFTIQDEIAAAIVEALKERLGLPPDAAARTVAVTNIEAHEAYLRGKYLLAQRGEAIASAVREFEKAIAFDPDYARAHAELAIAIGLQSSRGDLSDTEAIARATPHAERAMALDPALAEAHAAKGFLVWVQRNLEEALTHFRRAIELNPNYSIVHVWMGNLLYEDLGRYAEAFAMHEKAVRLDPLSMPAIYTYFFDLIKRNRLDEADRVLEKLASIAPAQYAFLRAFPKALGWNVSYAILSSLESLRIALGKTSANSILGMLFASIGLEKELLALSGEPPPLMWYQLGKPAEAVKAAEARLVDYAQARHGLGVALAAAGDYERARALLEETWQVSGRRVTSGGQFQITHAAALIAIRRAAGNEAGVGEIVSAIRNNVRRYLNAGIVRCTGDCPDYEEGLADFLAGEREKGLALIAKAVEMGWYVWPRQAYLQVLYDDPGFAPILAMQEAAQSRERKRVLDVVCNDNPYEAVWQPAEGTCERFAAAGGN